MAEMARERLVLPDGVREGMGTELVKCAEDLRWMEKAVFHGVVTELQELLVREMCKIRAKMELFYLCLELPRFVDDELDQGLLTRLCKAEAEYGRRVVEAYSIDEPDCEKLGVRLEDEFEDPPGYFVEDPELLGAVGEREDLLDDFLRWLHFRTVCRTTTSRRVNYFVVNLKGRNKDEDFEWHYNQMWMAGRGHAISPWKMICSYLDALEIWHIAKEGNISMAGLKLVRGAATIDWAKRVKDMSRSCVEYLCVDGHL